MHGGAIPAVQAAAKARLVAMVEPVLGAFEEILAAWRGTRCEACGRPTGDPAPVVQVGRIVLDRAGFHPTLTVEQVAPPKNEYADATEDEVIERLETLLERCRSNRDSKRQHQLADGAVDAEVLDEGFEVPEANTETLGQSGDVQNPSGIDTPDKGTTDDKGAK
jgi:hypothetical protein